MKNLVYIKNVTTLKLDTEKCTGCRMCINVCPHAVFKINNKKAVITYKDHCMECGACSLNCPANALTVRSGVGCAAGIIQSALKQKKSPLSVEI